MEATSKPTLNPFTYIGDGFKKLYKTNFWHLIVLQVVNVVLLSVTFIIFYKHVADRVNSGNHSGLLGLGVATGLIIALLVFVSVIVALASYRLILEGVRNQKATWSEALKLALNRFSLVLLIYLVLVVGSIVLAITIVGILVAIVVAIVFLPALIFAGFVLVDDEKPTGPIALIKTGNTRRRGWSGQVWMMFLVVVLISYAVGLLALAFGGNNKPTYTTTTVTTTNGYSYQLPSSTQVTKQTYRPASVVGNILSYLVSVVGAAGFAAIYAKAGHGKPKVAEAK